MTVNQSETRPTSLPGWARVPTKSRPKRLEADAGGHSQQLTTNRLSGERPDRVVGNVAGGGPPGRRAIGVEVGIFRLLFGAFRVSTRRFAGCPAGDVAFLHRWRAQVRCACWSALRHELRVPCFPSLHSREKNSVVTGSQNNSIPSGRVALRCDDGKNRAPGQARTV